MNFEEFFVKNRKLLKLNFILLGMLIFFLGTKYFDSKCYAVTQTELDNAGVSIAQWSEEVLNRYNLLNTDMLYFVYKSTSTSYKIVVFPDLNYNDVTAFFEMSNNAGYLNFADKIYAISDFNQDTVKFAYDKGLNVYILDYDLNQHTVTKNFVSGSQCSWGFYTTSSNSVGGSYMYPLNSISGTSNYDKLVANTIVYTNCKNYIVKRYGTNAIYDVYKPARLFDFNKKLEVVDFESYLIYGTDEIGGDYITLNSALSETNVDTILFEADKLMNNSTSYAVSTSMNFDLVKVYVNDSSEVKITFKDINSNTLYSCNKQLNSDSSDNDVSGKLFDYYIDYSESEVAEFNYNWYYKTANFVYKYDNIYNYNTDIVAGGNVYIPSMQFDVIFENGDSFTSNKFYYDFGNTNYCYIESLLAYYDSGSGEENLFTFSPYHGYFNITTDFLENINSGLLYKIKFNLTVDNYSVDNDENLHYLSTVNKTSYTVDFKKDTNLTTGTIVEIVDSNNNDIGYVVVDKNGNIISSNLNESFSGNGNVIYDSNNNIVGQFNKTDSGWQYVDANDNVIKDYVHVSIDDKIQNANNSNNIVPGFAESIGLIIETITSSLSLLLTSVTGIATLFASAFSWLPEPVPQLVVFVFSAMAIFALIRFIRGH